jgi:hypothetical protein
MLASSRIINCIRTATASWRYFSDVFRQELTVQTFCDLQVNLPYNVHIKPLDVHKYHNCDLLKIEVTGANSVKHVQDGSTIKIFGPNQDHDANTTCTIDAPVKASQSRSRLIPLKHFLLDRFKRRGSGKHSHRCFWWFQINLEIT